MLKLPAEPASLLEDFSSIIAHELRTPLAIVVGASELALTGYADDVPPELERLLQMVKRNADLASLLLGRLCLARDVEAGTVELSLEPVDIGELVSQSVSDLREMILVDHEVNVTLADTPLVQADATAAREVVFNLLSNAAKYSSPGAPIEVTVALADGMVSVVVRNHGAGVTPGDTQAIFEKYWQADESRSGAGLGLYISRGLARAHGGDLEVQPATDEGSEFRLSLPVSA